MDRDGWDVRKKGRGIEQKNKKIKKLIEWTKVW